LVDLQARMALKAEASRLYLSYLWWVIEPLLYVAVFYLVFNIFLRSGREDFLVFLIVGKIPFLWFSKSVTLASNSIVENRGLISQIDLPKTLFPYVSVFGALYKEWVVFLVMLMLVALHGYYPDLSWFWLIPVFVVQFLFILCCALIGAFLVSYVADIRMIISMGMMFLMFTSGIFWDINDIADPNKRALLFLFNPVAFFIDSYRKVLVDHGVIDLEHLLAIGFASLVLLALLHLVFGRYSKQLAARVLAL